MVKEKMTEVSKVSAAETPVATGRWAAGEDPAKRTQILEGAKSVFMKMGFDAASMNDVTREAGVSKGTLYVYFANKEELFTAMIETERAAFVAALRVTLEHHDNVEEGLHDFGLSFISHVTSEKVISAMRTVLGVRDRMPVLCQRFFNGPENLRTVLHAYLTRYVTSGELEIDDVDLAAGQFLDLASGSFFKFRLFGSMPEPPSEAERKRVIDGAIRVFMAAYGAKHNEPA